MTIAATLGNPTENGIYAARQWYAWRILEWHNGEWWHPGRTAKWPIGHPSGETGIEAHFGPLPVISKDFTKPPLAPPREVEFWEDQFREKPVQEYDL